MNELEESILRFVARPSYQPVKARVIAQRLQLPKGRLDKVKHAVKRLLRRGQLSYGGTICCIRPRRRPPAARAWWACSNAHRKASASCGPRSPNRPRRKPATTVARTTSTFPPIGPPTPPPATWCWSICRRGRGECRAPRRDRRGRRATNPPVRRHLFRGPPARPTCSRRHTVCPGRSTWAIPGPRAPGPTTKWSSRCSASLRPSTTAKA